uniref:Uncharacterized protein n=1 Tax=Anopheles quadriannulatus TaxID=34691 RepID=A0A182XQV5_ANOQN
TITIITTSPVCSRVLCDNRQVVRHRYFVNTHVRPAGRWRASHAREPRLRAVRWHDVGIVCSSLVNYHKNPCQQSSGRAAGSGEVRRGPAGELLLMGGGYCTFN